MINKIITNENSLCSPRRENSARTEQPNTCCVWQREREQRTLRAKFTSAVTWRPLPYNKDYSESFRLSIRTNHLTFRLQQQPGVPFRQREKCLRCSGQKCGLCTVLQSPRVHSVVPGMGLGGFTCNGPQKGGGGGGVSAKVSWTMVRLRVSGQVDTMQVKRCSGPHSAYHELLRHSYFASYELWSPFVNNCVVSVSVIFQNTL